MITIVCRTPVAYGRPAEPSHLGSTLFDEVERKIEAPAVAVHQLLNARMPIVIGRIDAAGGSCGPHSGFVAWTHNTLRPDLAGGSAFGTQKL